MDTFESVLAALARADVAFLVVGGVAVAQAGFARSTDALDLFTQRSGHAYADLLPLSTSRDVLGVPVRFLGSG
jgi:hypothetical protein